MKERITFVHKPNDAFDPDQLRLDNDALVVKSLKAAREDRITLSPHELPQEVWRMLKQCHELHIRWVSLTTYDAVAPFVSRASSGLHIFFTPQRNRSAPILSLRSDLLCPLLLKVFGEHLKCESPEKTFTGLPVTSERFASSAAFQYHQLLPSLTNLIIYIQQKICPPLDKTCHAKATALSSANHVDIDYDAISQAFVLRAFFQQAPGSDVWDERIQSLGEAAAVEVGVLANESPTKPEELSLGGFLTILGEDTKPNPTLFSFPSRHHLVTSTFSSTYLTTFVSPTGLHPTLRLTFPVPAKPPSPSCALLTYLILPSGLFPDKYQLSSPLFLASKNLRAIRSLSGETDLEAPDWVIEKWGSSLLIELAPPKGHANAAKPVSWNADIPLHMRYLPPSAGGSSEVQLPWPTVFWACTAEEGTKMNVNPFDRVNLGYDGLFGPRTMFYHLEPDAGATGLVESLAVPVLDLDRATWVEEVTVGVVTLGVVWVAWKLFEVGLKDWRNGKDSQKKRQ